MNRKPIPIRPLVENGLRVEETAYENILVILLAIKMEA